MAKLRIEGREYPAVDHRGATLLHLVELREHTRKLLEVPLGMGRLDELSRMAREQGRRRTQLEAAHAAAVEGGEPAAVLEDLAEQLREVKAAQADDGLLGLAIIVFLTRRKAGDRVTFAQATNVDVDLIEWVPEDSDEQPVAPSDDDVPDDPFGPGAAPDPTVPGRGSPATPDDDPARLEAPTTRTRKGRKGGRSTTSARR